MSVATAFYQTWWWATFSPVVFFVLAQQLAEHRADVRARRARATGASHEPTSERPIQRTSNVAAPRRDPPEPLLLSAVSEERNRKRTRPKPATPPQANTETAIATAVVVVVVISYLYLADPVRVLIGALAALGIGYAFGQLRSLHRQDLVGDDWLPLLRAATVIFALGFVELYLLIHPLFAGDRLDVLLEAFRNGGPAQLTVLGGFSGWLVVAAQAVGAFLVLLAFVGLFRMLFGLSAEADSHAGVRLRNLRSAILRWEVARGQTPWSEVRMAGGLVVIALFLSSGGYFAAFQQVGDIDSEPRISQVAAASSAGKIRLRFGLDRAATVRVTLRRAGETRPVRVLVLRSHAGINDVRFGRSASGEPVRRGRYRLRLAATAGAGTSERTSGLTVGP